MSNNKTVLLRISTKDSKQVLFLGWLYEDETESKVSDYQNLSLSGLKVEVLKERFALDA